MTLTIPEILTDPTRRHDFVLLFEVTDGNPNGDPDAGNLPRVDPETMHGLVTDVAIKRRIRDWVDLTRGHEPRYAIYVQSRGIALNELHRRAYEALGETPTGSRQDPATVARVQQWMAQNFFDIRLFGAVMTTDVNCGQVRGPVQFTFARSVDPIAPLDLTITRVAVTRPEDLVRVEEETGEARGKRTEMGRKPIVPYALYRAHGFFIPAFAARTGVTPEDLSVFWTALVSMWDVDRSSSRGMTACRGVYVFTHDNGLGRAPSHKLFECVRIRRREGVGVPRRFDDYLVEVVDPGLEGVTLTRLFG